VTATLPSAVHDVFHRFVTCELTTVDSHGRPITWPVTPFYRAGDQTISVTTGLGYPKKANDARRNPKVALLFSDPTGSDIARPPMVLVQGIAEVDDRDLAANRERYGRDTVAKPTGGSGAEPPSGALGRRFDWYFTRIYIHVRPERVHVWRGGDCAVEPEVVEEAGRRADQDEPPAPPAHAGAAKWDGRIAELGRLYGTAALAWVAPDGFPFAVRVPVAVERRERVIRIEEEPAGAPLRPGPACVTAHDHDEQMSWTRNFQVRGDLLQQGLREWVVVPHRVVHGFELPPAGALTRVMSNYRKIRRFRRTAKRERERRG
jgi:hypothetical protein